MRAVGFTSALVSNLIALCPAMADWQYTKWGMTPQQVMSASKGAAVANADRSLDASDGSVKTELVAPYQAGGFQFRAGFMFGRDEKLKAVNLALQSGSCPSLLGSLTSTYGPEQSKSNTSALQIAAWWDQKHANRVNYAVIGSHCYVQYSPLSLPGQPGGL